MFSNSSAIIVKGNVSQVAYVPQSAFIYNASVRDNILFGLPFQQERYDQAIAAAAVRPDLDNMAGDCTVSFGQDLACTYLAHMSWKALILLLLLLSGQYPTALLDLLCCRRVYFQDLYLL